MSKGGVFEVLALRTVEEGDIIDAEQFEIVQKAFNLIGRQALTLTDLKEQSIQSNLRLRRELQGAEE